MTIFYLCVQIPNYCDLVVFITVILHFLNIILYYSVLPYARIYIVAFPRSNLILPWPSSVTYMTYNQCTPYRGQWLQSGCRNKNCHFILYTIFLVNNNSKTSLLSQNILSLLHRRTIFVTSSFQISNGDSLCHCFYLIFIFLVEWWSKEFSIKTFNIDLIVLKCVMYLMW